MRSLPGAALALPSRCTNALRSLRVCIAVQFRSWVRSQPDEEDSAAPVGVEHQIQAPGVAHTPQPQLQPAPPHQLASPHQPQEHQPHQPSQQPQQQQLSQQPPQQPLQQPPQQPQPQQQLSQQSQQQLSPHLHGGVSPIGGQATTVAHAASPRQRGAPMHRTAPSLYGSPRRAPPRRDPRFAACPFAMVDLGGYGFAHNGMSSGQIKRPDVASRYLDFRDAFEKQLMQQSHARSEAAVRANIAAFERADVNRDGHLDLPEFRALVSHTMPHTAEAHEEHQVREWFGCLGGDTSGTISLAEYAVFALQEGLERTGSKSLLEFARGWDGDESGTLCRSEFEQMAQRLGFGSAVEELLQGVPCHGDEISYRALLLAFRRRGTSVHSRRAFQAKYTLNQRITASRATGVGTRSQHRGKDARVPGPPSPRTPPPPPPPPAPATSQQPPESEQLSRLRTWLSANVRRVEHVAWRLFDMGDESLMGVEELQRALQLLGYDGRPETLSAFLHTLDGAEGGRVPLRALQEWACTYTSQTHSALKSQTSPTTPMTRRRPPALRHEALLRKVLTGYDTRYLKPPPAPASPTGSPRSPGARSTASEAAARSQTVASPLAARRLSMRPQSAPSTPAQGLHSSSASPKWRQPKPPPASAPGMGTRARGVTTGTHFRLDGAGGTPSTPVSRQERWPYQSHHRTPPPQPVRSH